MRFGVGSLFSGHFSSGVSLFEVFDGLRLFENDPIHGSNVFSSVPFSCSCLVLLGDAVFKVKFVFFEELEERLVTSESLSHTQ